MTNKANQNIRLNQGHTKSDNRPIAYSIAEAADLLFNQNTPWDEIKVTKDIYPGVAKQLGESSSATSHSVERLVDHCWDHMAPQQKIEYIGRDFEDITSTTDFIVYLAYYLHYNRPYFEVMRTQFAER